MLPIGEGQLLCSLVLMQFPLLQVTQSLIKQAMFSPCRLLVHASNMSEAWICFFWQQIPLPFPCLMDTPNWREID